MKVRVEAWHLPPRLLTGVYFLNTGLSKAGADEATAAQLHGFASGPIRSWASSTLDGSRACCLRRRPPLVWP